MEQETRRLSGWLEEVSAELGLDLEIDADDRDLLLDLARDAAHSVTRPAAPLTTFLIGVAVGRGHPLSTVTAAVTRLTEQHRT